MRLRDVMAVTEAKALSDNLDPDLDLLTAGATDLMSDALRYDLMRSLLISGLANPQLVRTAEMADVSAVLLVRGKIPPPETVKLAQQVGIPILATDLIMFEACGRLFAAGMPACKRRNAAG